MKGLLYKDFKLITNNVGFLISASVLLVAIIGSWRIINFPVINTLGISIFFGLFISISSLRIDEYNNFYNFGLTCPVSYIDFVLPKYIMMWIVSLSIFILSFSLQIIFNQLPIIQALIISITVILIQTLILSLFILLNYKLGSQTSQIIIMLLFLCIAIVIPRFKYLQSFIINSFNKSIINNFNKSSLPLILFLLCVITILINGLSFLISVKVIENKEV